MTGITASRPLTSLSPPGEAKTVRFLIGWYVPNFSKYWVTPVWHFEDSPAHIATWKNWYATEWPGVVEIAQEVFRNWDRLRSETVLFRDALYGSSLPHPVLDAAAANLSILKTATVARLPDGTFYGWEGFIRMLVVAKAVAPTSGIISKPCRSCFPSLETEHAQGRLHL